MVCVSYLVNIDEASQGSDRFVWPLFVPYAVVEPLQGQPQSMASPSAIRRRKTTTASARGRMWRDGNRIAAKTMRQPTPDHPANCMGELESRASWQDRSRVRTPAQGLWARLTGQSHLRIVQGKETQFLSCELESCKLTAQSKCSHAIFPPRRPKIALLTSRAELAGLSAEIFVVANLHYAGVSGEHQL
jgi:hypothetical protein